MEAESAEPVAAPRKEGDKPVSKVTIVGYFVVTDRHISGWTWDKASPELSLHVQLRVDGEALSSTTADRQREDLERAGVGTGKYGFTFDLPESVLAEEAARIKVFASKSPEHNAVPLTNRSLPRPPQPDVQDGTAIPFSKAAHLEPGDRRNRFLSSSPPGNPAPQVEARATKKPQQPLAPVEENLGFETSKPLLAAISGAEKAIEDRLDTIAAEVRSLASRAAVSQSAEDKLEEVRAAVDALGRQLSAVEVFQTRLDSAVAAIASRNDAAGSQRGGDRGLTLAVAALSLISCASLVLGLISVF